MTSLLVSDRNLVNKKRDRIGRAAMTPWINYHHLFHFKTVAELGSISRASEVLNVGKSALSTQIKILEETLNQTLFERHLKKLILTHQGKIVLKYAQEIFRTGDELLDILHDEHSGQTTQLQIGIHDNIPKNMAIQILDFVYQSRPKIRCIVETGANDRLLHELDQFQLDFLIMNSSPQDPKRHQVLLARRIFRQKIGVYAAPQFKHLAKNFPKSLQGCPFLLPGVQSHLRPQIEEYFRKNKIEIENIGEFHDSALEKYMALKGIGVMAILPPAVSEFVQEGKLIQLGELPIYDEIWLIALKRKTQHPLWEQISKNFHFPE